MNERTGAEQAFSEMLFLPMPKTPLDFRRAIVMAVLIGRQLEAECAGSLWQNTQPTEPGVWEVNSVEIGSEAHRVRVFEQDGQLWVECPDVGTNTVDAYHHGLIDTRWRRVILR